MSKKTKLFLSITGMKRAIAENRVDHDDLAAGLFYLRCSREFFFRESYKLIKPVMFDWNPKKKEVFCHTCSVAVFLAEGEGRCVWRKKNKRSVLKEVNSVLKKNGFSPVCIKQSKHPLGYELREIVALVKRANPNLDIVC